MKSLFIRYILALFVAIGNNLFSLVLLPITVYVSFFILSLFYNAQLLDKNIIILRVSFSFIPACAATLTFVLLLELILLTRNISFIKGLKMFLVGSLIIFILNIARIFILIFVYLQLGKNYFDLLHIFFWQVISTVFVVLVWIFLIKYFNVKSVPLISDIKKILKK